MILHTFRLDIGGDRIRLIVQIMNNIADRDAQLSNNALKELGQYGLKLHGFASGIGFAKYIV